MLKKDLMSGVFIIGVRLSEYLQLLEQTIAAAPFLIASLMYFSPFNLWPFIAKKIKPFLIFFYYLFQCL